jgi:hypothetical protein
MQRIFSSAGAPDNTLEEAVACSALAELKIGWTKPRANEGAMGIECSGRGGDNRRGPSEVSVTGAHAFAGAAFFRWWRSRCQERSARWPEGCRAPSSFFCKRQEFRAGLGKPCEGTIGRVGAGPAHERSPQGGARSEAGRTAITTICPRWQTGHSRRDLPVSSW